jgi:hypothetical protein
MREKQAEGAAQSSEVSTAFEGDAPKVEETTGEAANAEERIVEEPAPKQQISEAAPATEEVSQTCEADEPRVDETNGEGANTEEIIVEEPEATEEAPLAPSVAGWCCSGDGQQNDLVVAIVRRNKARREAGLELPAS